MCPRCGNNPCSCTAALDVVKTESLFLLRECESPDCHVMIREPRSFVGSRFCKWCTAKGVTVTYEPLQDVPVLPVEPRYLTREQFGDALYACIALFAGRQFVRQEYKRTVTDLDLSVAERKRRLSDLKAKEKDCDTQILAVMPTLSTADQHRLLQRFESRGAA